MARSCSHESWYRVGFEADQDPLTDLEVVAVDLDRRPGFAEVDEVAALPHERREGVHDEVVALPDHLGALTSPPVPVAGPPLKCAASSNAVMACPPRTPVSSRPIGKSARLA